MNLIYVYDTVLGPLESAWVIYANNSPGFPTLWNWFGRGYYPSLHRAVREGSIQDREGISRRTCSSSKYWILKLFDATYLFHPTVTLLRCKPRRTHSVFVFFLYRLRLLLSFLRCKSTLADLLPLLLHRCCRHSGEEFVCTSISFVDIILLKKISNAITLPVRHYIHRHETMYWTWSVLPCYEGYGFDYVVTHIILVSALCYVRRFYSESEHNMHMVTNNKYSLPNKANLWIMAGFNSNSLIRCICFYNIFPSST